MALHSTGLDITDNTVTDYRNDGIQIWRSLDGEDGSIVARKPIFARSGGSGQNGNDINVFRAGGVRVGGNRITDSAVRGNLERCEFEPVHKRGEGIAVEADASVIGNTVENAPMTGIVIGWGR